MGLVGKHCGKCNTLKPVKEFAKNRRKRDGLQSQCRTCQRATQASWYSRNKGRHVGNVKSRTLKVSAGHRQKLLEYLSEHPCVDCGEKDPLVLEFDHVRGRKRGNVSKMVCCGYAWKTVEREIAKCEVRCANCHRRKTARTLWPRRFAQCV